MSDPVIVATVASVLLVEGVLIGAIWLMGLRGVEMLRAVGFLHAVYGLAGTVIGALSLLWVWALQ